MAVPPVFALAASTQSYDWGKVGRDSKVALFAESALPDFNLDGSKPYAELWMGTHVTSPSHLIPSGVSLRDHLSKHPELIGDSIANKFDTKKGDLPFLFKVLAIRKALSIQTHPSKEEAERLHREQPNVYKDDNHKPEMALALGPFAALCGFRPLPQIISFIKGIPELAALIPPTVLSEFKKVASTPESQHTDIEARNALRNVFAAVMTAPEDEVKAQLNKLVSRYTGISDEVAAEIDEVESELRPLVVTLNEQFPGDIGIFCVFLLNYMTLDSGEAIFLKAGEPHAYISGDIVECMATSDNVIRAGLTPKLRDVPNLVANLSYQPGQPQKHFVKPSKFDDNGSTLYNPPTPEFSVLHLEIENGSERTQKAVEGPSTAVVAQGSGEVRWGNEKFELKTGTVFFVGAGTEVRYSATSTDQSLHVYRAFVEA